MSCKVVAKLPREDAREEARIPSNCKYILENVNLFECQQQNSEIYDQLFDTLENLCGSKEDALWVHRLYRSSIKKPEFALTVPEPDQEMCDNISSDHAVQYKDSDVIPNLYNTLDPCLTFNEIVDWLGKSAKVINMIMFFEGLWTWMWFNKDVQVECTETFIAEVFKIKRKRNWRGIYSGFIYWTLSRYL